MKKIISVLLLSISVLSVFALTVQDLEDSAILNNAAVRTSAQDVEKARLDVKNAKAGMMPAIDLTVTGSYLCNPIDPIRINLGDYVASPSVLNGFGNDFITVYEGQEKTYYQFSLSATQPVFTWGKLKNAVELYSKIYDVRRIQYADTLEKTYTEIKTRFAVLYYLGQIQTILQQQQAISSRLVELSKAALDNGMMIETDFLGIKVKTSQIDVAKAQIDQQIMQMQTALKGLTGVSVKCSDIEFDESVLFDMTDNLTTAGYDSLLIKAVSSERNNFKMLNNLSEVSNLSKNIASASRIWIPDFAFVVNVNYQGARLPLIEKDWYGKDDWDATLTLALKTTIFDGGKAEYAYKKSQNDITQAEINTDDARTQVTSALTENFTNLSVCQTNISYQNALSEQLEAKALVQQNLLDSGYGSESDLLQVKLDLNNAVINGLQAKISLVTSAYAIGYLTGLY